MALLDAIDTHDWKRGTPLFHELNASESRTAERQTTFIRSTARNYYEIKYVRLLSTTPTKTYWKMNTSSGRNTKCEVDHEYKCVSWNHCYGCVLFFVLGRTFSRYKQQIQFSI